MLNLEYLRSGAQFLPAAAPDGRSDLDPEAPASATQRLTRFHDATASAAAAAAKKKPGVKVERALCQRQRGVSPVGAAV